MAGKVINLLGMKFGRLTVVSLNTDPTIKGASAQWNCLCECGKTKRINGQSLRRGLTLSCGCLQKEINLQLRTTHGKTRTPIYHVWSNMKRRCTDPNMIQYKDYGGRGVTVCDRWLNSFEDFLTDVGEPPTPKHTIDRIDNSKGYEPGNVKWSTREEQNRNKRSNKNYTVDGVTKTIGEWAKHYGVKSSTLYRRLVVTGLSMADAVNLPNQRGKKF